MRRLIVLVLLAVAGFAVVGCGNPSGDDFLVHRTGSIPGAKLTLRVIDDGHVSCDISHPRILP